MSPSHLMALWSLLCAFVEHFGQSGAWPGVSMQGISPGTISQLINQSEITYLKPLERLFKTNTVHTAFSFSLISFWTSSLSHKGLSRTFFYLQALAGTCYLSSLWVRWDSLFLPPSLVLDTHTTVRLSQVTHNPSALLDWSVYMLFLSAECELG